MYSADSKMSQISQWTVAAFYADQSDSSVSRIRRVCIASTNLDAWPKIVSNLTLCGAQRWKFTLVFISLRTKISPWETDKLEIIHLLSTPPVLHLLLHLPGVSDRRLIWCRTQSFIFCHDLSFSRSFFDLKYSICLFPGRQPRCTSCLK